MMTTDDLNIAYRHSLYAFIARSFKELNATPFIPGDYLRVMAHELEECFRGSNRRLIINLPPRYLKSHSVSIAFVAWLLGLNPRAQIICASYGQDLADKHSRDCRKLMMSPRYQSIFRTRLSTQKKSTAEFETTDGGFRMATSVGGSITGRGSEWIIVDDALKPDDAVSESQREKANEWFKHTIQTRLNDKKTGRIILIMHRLHEDDLTGRLLSEDPTGWRVVRFPAIAEEAQELRLRDALGDFYFRRAVGEALHPERESLEVLANIRKDIGEFNFAGQYQQWPVPLGGGIIKLDSIRFYTPEETPQFEYYLQSWDTAYKANELNDYSALTNWGISNKNMYLTEVLRERLDYPRLIRAVLDMSDKYKPARILIEERGSGISLLQDLAYRGLWSATAFQPTGDKVMRMHSVSNMFAQGRIFVPVKAPWLAAYLNEITRFPRARHDDQADSTSQALTWIWRKYDQAPANSVWHFDGTPGTLYS